jgi:hypothetical protein
VEDQVHTDKKTWVRVRDVSRRYYNWPPKLDVVLAFRQGVFPWCGPNSGTVFSTSEHLFQSSWNIAVVKVSPKGSGKSKNIRPGGIRRVRPITTFPRGLGYHGHDRHETRRI